MGQRPGVRDLGFPKVVAVVGLLNVCGASREWSQEEPVFETPSWLAQVILYLPGKLKADRAVGPQKTSEVSTRG